MAEHDRQGHLRLLEPVGHGEVAAIGIDQPDVVADDVKHPEAIGRAAQVTTHFAVAVLQQRRQPPDIGTQSAR